MSQIDSTNQTNYEEYEGVNYSVIASGSSGNCVVIKDVMIDCGIPFKRLQPYLYDIKYLILSHVHSDHIKESTLNRIKRLFPKITIIGNYEVAQQFGVDIISNTNIPVVTKDYTFLPFLAPHDVLCHGYRWKVEDKSVMYCTDCSKLPEFDEDYKVDMLFLESNHDPVKVQQAIRFGGASYHATKGSSRHLSKDAAYLFYYMHRENNDSLFVELHKSSKFY